MIKELPNRKLTNQDLFDAYTVAGTRFGAEISHNFVVLNVRTALTMSRSRERRGPRRNPKEGPKPGTSKKGGNNMEANRNGQKLSNRDPKQGPSQ